MEYSVCALGSVGVTEFLQPGRTLGLQDFCGLGGFRGCRTSAAWGRRISTAWEEFRDRRITAAWEDLGVAELLQPGRSLGVTEFLWHKTLVLYFDWHIVMILQHFKYISAGTHHL